MQVCISAFIHYISCIHWLHLIADFVQHQPILSFARTKLRSVLFPPFDSLTSFPPSTNTSHFKNNNSALVFLTSDLPLSEHMDFSDFLCARSHWLSLEKTKDITDELELQLSLLRAQFLVGHWALWDVVSQQVRDVAQAVVSGNPQLSPHADHWLFILVKHLHHKLYFSSGTHQAVQVAFHDLFPNGLGDTSGLAVVPLGYSRPFLSANNSARLWHLIVAARDVVAHWVGLRHVGSKRSRERWDVQGVFLDLILDIKHPGLLLLPETYQVFRFCQAYSISQSEAKSVHALFSHLCSTHPNEVNLLDDIFLGNFPPLLSLASHKVWQLEEGMDLEISTADELPIPLGIQDSSGSTSSSVENAAVVVAKVLADLSPIWNASGFSYMSTLNPKHYKACYFLFANPFVLI